MEKFVIIDGNSLLNRAFYALPQLANSEGVVSNAVFGFTTILVKIINEINPKYICVALDYGKQTFRKELFAEYKGTRKPTPPELKNQFPILRDLLKSMGITYIEQEGIEADDIIGTLTKKFNTENIIVTGDKDSFQLINDNTWVMFTRKGVSETINYNPGQLFNDYGLKPHQIIDLKALMGDASDNIPGVAGVGEKTALGLLEKYETVDGVYNNINLITGKLKEKLELNKEMAFLSKTLATIKTDCELDYNLSDFEYQFPFNSTVHKFFMRYQFNSLLKKPELFTEIEADEISNDIVTVTLKCLEQVNEIINLANKEKRVYLSLDGVFSITVGNTEFNLEQKFDLLSAPLELADVLQKLEPVFSDVSIKKCVFDYKSILHKLSAHNIVLNGVCFDVLIARYLVNNNNKANIGLVDVLNENAINNKLLSYNLKMLETHYSKKLEEYNLNEVMFNIELPLTYVLFNMEKTGFKIDKTELNLLEEKYSQELKVVTEEIYDLAGMEFNINSPKQLGEVLFDEDKLHLYCGNNKKKSTGIDVLNNLKNDHPIIEKIIRYRQISKLYTTYVKAFEELINPETGKIYTTFNQTLTSTGRLSSSEPNLQNIPVRTDEGKGLRKIFVPTNPNGYIVSADYSQIELRLLAAFSSDPQLVKAYNEGKDIHATTASQVFGVDLNDVTSQMRRDAKAINFGIIYGISDYGLSQNIGSTRKVAKDYIDKYFAEYPAVKQYMETNVNFCKEMGYSKTMFGRIRFIPEIKSSNFNIRQLGERAAMNMPLQGTASDIIKLAMIKVFNRINSENLKSKLILQIHDELIVDCEPNELEQIKTILTEEMENVVNLNVGLEVNISYGNNWFEAK